VGKRITETSFTHPNNPRTIQCLSPFIQSTGYYTIKKVNVSLGAPILFYDYLSKTVGIIDYNLEFIKYLGFKGFSYISPHIRKIEIIYSYNSPLV
jgi:hypothetical protein